jgi:hypothetical protein
MTPRARKETSRMNTRSNRRATQRQASRAEQQSVVHVAAHNTQATAQIQAKARNAG